MDRLRNMMFVVLLLVAFSTGGASARGSSMDFFEDYLDFYNCTPWFDGNTYTVFCESNCEDNPYFELDSWDVCDYWCGGHQFVNESPVGECIAGCSCKVPD